MINPHLVWADLPVGPPENFGELRLEPLVGFEPTTYSLRMNCSTPELQRLFTDPRLEHAERNLFYRDDYGLQQKSSPALPLESLFECSLSRITQQQLLLFWRLF